MALYNILTECTLLYSFADDEGIRPNNKIIVQVESVEYNIVCDNRVKIIFITRSSMSSTHKHTN